MKNRFKKLMVIIGIAGALSMVVYGCGGKAEETEVRQEKNTEQDEGTKTSGEASEGKESEAQEEAAEAGYLEKVSVTEELYGDICEIGNMQFAVSEIMVMGDENGTEIMVSAASGSEEAGNLITVAYDENTRFYKKTIWNGGKDYEDADASADDLTEGFTAEMKGHYEGEIFYASEVWLVEVILP